MELAALADHGLGVVGPHPGGVDHLLGADLVLAAALHVLHPGADDPLALAQERRHPGSVGGLRAVGRGGAHEVQHEAGVVHLGVVVLQGADQRVLLQAGSDTQGVTTAQVAVHGQAPAVAVGHRHGVVERDARTGVEPLPTLVLERVEERHRPHEVRGELLQQQAALLQRLTHQGEVEHLQIAQAAVDQLAGPAGRARRPVTGLDQSGGQAARHRVERRARTDHAAAHHQHVQLALRHGRQ